MKRPGRNDMDRNGDEMKSGDEFKSSAQGHAHGGGIECERVLDLAPTYADGELSRDLAASVGSHLMDCSPCRLAVQDHVSLGSWFVPTEELPVPAGFASRVAELAFSGASPEGQGGPGKTDGRGERHLTLTPRAPQLAPRSVEPTPEDRGRLLSFSMALTAAAAAAALFLTIFLASREEPGVGAEPIRADDDLEVNLEALRQENRALTEAAEALAAGPEVTQSEDGK